MDTEKSWQDARTLTLRDYDLVPAPGFAERSLGVHYTQCGQLMAEEAGRPELSDTLANRLLDHFKKLVADHPKTMPGAPELVATAVKFAPLAVASNCPREVVEACLSNTGLREHFDHIVVPGEGIRPKPHPDVYLTAARACGAAPESALAVEDSAVGVEAAARAGLRVMGVGPWPGEQVASLVDLWVEALDEPDVFGWASERIPRRSRD